MDEYEFDERNPLRLKKKSEQNRKNDDDDDDVEEVGFKRKSRYANKRKNNEITLSGYASDSSVDSDSDVDRNLQQNKNSLKDDDQSIQDGVLENGNGSVVNHDHENKRSKKLGFMDMEQFKKDNLDESMGEDISIEAPIESDGIKIEAFNVEDETKNGLFDQNGNYIELKLNQDDQLQAQDKWIEDCENVQKVAANKMRHNLMMKERVRAIQKGKRHYMIEDALLRLKFFVDKESNVMSVLSKFNKLRNDKKFVSNHNSVQYIVNAINFLTDLIDILDSKGITDVYDLTRSDVETLILEEAFDDSSTIDNYKSKIWTFKWLTKLDEVQKNHTNYEMQYWKASYFNNNVVVKLDDEPDEERNWVHIQCVTFM